jgi:hypothetical protein
LSELLGRPGLHEVRNSGDGVAGRHEVFLGEGPPCAAREVRGGAKRARSPRQLPADPVGVSQGAVEDDRFSRSGPSAVRPPVVPPPDHPCPGVRNSSSQRLMAVRKDVPLQNPRRHGQTVWEPCLRSHLNALSCRCPCAIRDDERLAAVAFARHATFSRGCGVLGPSRGRVRMRSRFESSPRIGQVHGAGGAGLPSR